MKTVLFVITKGDSIGGAQIYIIRLARFLKKEFNVVVAYGLKSDDKIKSYLDDLNIKSIRIDGLKNSLNPLHMLKGYLNLKEIITEIKPDIVSLNSSMVGILGRICCKVLNVKWVLTVHGWSFTDGIIWYKKSLYETIERFACKLGGNWILVSKFDFDLGKKTKTINQFNSRVIYNSFQKNTSEKKFKYNKDDFNIVMVARHTKQKDHKTLIKSVQEINNIKVYLIGDGDLFKSNMNYAKQQNSIDKFEFLGYENDVYKYLSNCDLFVLISNWEGFPISTLEAMSFGKPCIISNVGGASEAIENGVNGYVINRGDDKSLSQKINLVKSNPDLRLKMGLASKRIVEEKFSEDIMFNNTIEFFNQIINKK